MSSNENNTRVDDAISKLLRDGRGHSALGKKMNLPMPEEIGLPIRPRHDPPPGYGKTEELSAPPDYKGKAPVTAEKKAPSAVAEKAAVAAEPPKVAPLYLLPTKNIKPHPVHAAYQKMMAGFDETVKTQQEVEQGTKLSDYDIARRADALFIAKNLKLRYFHECSEAHFNEFQRLVAEEGKSIDEACAAHSDFGAWMASEIERQRRLSPEEAEADVEKIMARLRL